MSNEEAGVSPCCSDEPCNILWIQIPVPCVMSWHFQGLLNSLLWIVVAVRALLLKNSNDSAGTNKQADIFCWMAHLLLQQGGGKMSLMLSASWEWLLVWSYKCEIYDCSFHWCDIQRYSNKGLKGYPRVSELRAQKVAWRKKQIEKYILVNITKLPTSNYKSTNKYYWSLLWWRKMLKWTRRNFTLN